MANKWNLDGIAVTTQNVVVIDTFAVASLPTEVAGGVIYVSNGAAGDPVLAFSDGTDWLRCDTLAAVAAS
jgi:hypothetical protein